MSATPPRTSREALIAEMLGDLDQILGRIEKIPDLIGAVEASHYTHLFSHLKTTG